MPVDKAVEDAWRAGREAHRCALATILSNL